MVEYQKFYMVQPDTYKHAVLSICYHHFKMQAFLLFCSINWKKFLLLSMNLFPCNFHPMAIVLSSGNAF